MDVAVSKNNVPIRLTSERWQHISVGHPEVADFYYEILETVENPQVIYEGSEGGLMAVSLEVRESGKFIVVIYRELSPNDGFIITAYISNKAQKFEKRKIIWQQGGSDDFYESLFY